MKIWIHPKITWKRFEKFNRPYRGDIYPVNGDRMLWQMLRDRKINMYFDTKEKEDPVIITTSSIPKNIKKFIV